MTKSRDLRNYGTAALENTQTSLTDTTTNALMKVGAFGLGATTVQAAPNNDLNDITVSGDYYGSAGSSANTPSSGISFQVTHNSVSNADFAVQTAIGYGGSVPTDINRMFVRHKDSGVWESWNEVITADAAGNVGIGAITPNVALDVARSGIGEVIEFTDGVTDTGHLGIVSGGGCSLWAGGFLTLGAGGGATNTERMRLDSSGNLLVGKTASSDTAGIQLEAIGTGKLIADGRVPLYLDRLTNDGDIAVFRKGGTIAGTIGSAANGTEIYLAGAGANTSGIFCSNGNSLLSMKAGVLANGTQDLGSSSYKFKDLHLSGGVVFGGAGGSGTSTSNTLDSYEEGTFTPTLGGGATATSMSGTYTKVGRLVTITLSLLNSTITGSPNNIVSGLPFTNGSKRSSLIPVYHTTFNTTCETVGGIVQSSSVDIEFLGLLKGAGWTPAPLTAGSGRYLHLTASYETA